MKKFTIHRVGVALLLAAALIPIGNQAGADGKRTVEAVGGFTFEPNEFIQLTFRFDPGKITVERGKKVTWKDVTEPDPFEGPEPHTITIVDKKELPRTVPEVFGCFVEDPSKPPGVCNLAAGHFADEKNPTLVLNQGREGLDTRGDSLFLRPGQSITAKVTASKGTTLYYLCAIHPWMQGKIKVEDHD